MLKNTIVADQTVFLTEDKTKAVAEGDLKAKFLLVRKGREIATAKAEQYAGAIELLGGKAEKHAAKTEDKPDPHKRVRNKRAT